MGIMGHGDFLRGKHTTALVLDHAKRAHAVPIKHTIGRFFLAAIGNDLYGFDTADAPVYTIGDVGSKQARFIIYHVSHTKALDIAKLDKVAEVLTANGLGKVDRQKLRLLSLLGRAEAKREKRIYEVRQKRGQEAADKEAAKWEGHDLMAVAQHIQENAKDWPDLAGKLATYIDELGIERIRTPVREITEHIEKDLVSTEPTFLGELCTRYGRVDIENRAMTNAPKTSSTSWMKWGVLMGGVLMIVVVVMMGITEGWFDSLGSFIPTGLDANTLGQAFNPNALGGQALSQVGGAAGVDCSAEGIQSRYASPLDLKIAVQAGAETCELPEAVEKSLEHVQAPVATAVPADGAPEAAAPTAP